jgi:hypothetical protein
MSSPEELTFVVGRWLWAFMAILYVGRRLGFWPTSNREQRSTALKARNSLSTGDSERSAKQQNLNRPEVSLKFRVWRMP